MLVIRGMPSRSSRQRETSESLCRKARGSPRSISLHKAALHFRTGVASLSVIISLQPTQAGCCYTVTWIAAMGNVISSVLQELGNQQAATVLRQPFQRDVVFTFKVGVAR